MLEYPVEELRWLVFQKISQHKAGLQARGFGAFGRQLDRTWGQIVTGDSETSLCPHASVVSGAAAGDQHGAALEFRMRRDEIDQARRSFTFFPRHVAGLVALFPIRVAHAIL